MAKNQVIRHLNDGPYEVSFGKNTYCWNRAHLKPTNEHTDKSYPLHAPSLSKPVSPTIPTKSTPDKAELQEKKETFYGTTVDRTPDKVPIADQNQRQLKHLLPAELDQEGLSNHIIIE